MIRNSLTLPLKSAARTATTVSPVMRNTHHKGVTVTLAVTAASGTGGLTLHIRGYDSAAAGGAVFDLLVDGSAIVATGTYVFMLEEQAATGGATRAVASRPMTKNWDIQVVHGDASSYTYSVSALLLAL